MSKSLMDQLTVTEETERLGPKMVLKGRRGAITAQVFNVLPGLPVEMTVHSPTPAGAGDTAYPCTLTATGVCYPQAGSLHRDIDLDDPAALKAEMERWYLQHFCPAG